MPPPVPTPFHRFSTMKSTMSSNHRPASLSPPGPSQTPVSPMRIGTSGMFFLYQSHRPNIFIRVSNESHSVEPPLPYWLYGSQPKKSNVPFGGSIWLHRVGASA